MRYPALIATGLALTLSACGLGGLSSAANGPCPRIGVLQDASNFPVKDQAGNIRALARLNIISNSGCVYDKSNTDRTGFSTMRTVLKIQVAAARSGSTQMSSVTVPVIIATISADGLLTGRQKITLDVPFNNGGTGSEEEEVEVRINYKGSGDADTHRIVAAFDLDRDEVLLNRSRQGR
ncbi:MAG: hypothetical protein P1U65_10020 [Minwuia sp.]|nr:hypothetical protein [Minwuia sp.]